MFSLSKRESSVLRCLWNSTLVGEQSISNMQTLIYFEGFISDTSCKGRFKRIECRPKSRFWSLCDILFFYDQFALSDDVISVIRHVLFLN